MEKREEQKRKGCVRNRIQELCPLVVCFWSCLGLIFLKCRTKCFLQWLLWQLNTITCVKHLKHCNPLMIFFILHIYSPNENKDLFYSPVYNHHLTRAPAQSKHLMCSNGLNTHNQKWEDTKLLRTRKLHTEKEKRNVSKRETKKQRSKTKKGKNVKRKPMERKEREETKNIVDSRTAHWAAATQQWNL